MSAQITLTKESTLKYMAMHGILALIIIAALGWAVSSLGSISLDAMTILTVVAGAGISAAAMAHLKGNILLIGFFGGSSAAGSILVIAAIIGVSSLSGALILLFVGNAIASMVVRYFHKG